MIDPMSYPRLSREFFLQPTIEVAKALLGKVFVHRSVEGILAGRIVEDEAYSQEDPACHCSRGKTQRNATMFGEPGHAYVYFTYGMHYCLNCVTQPPGTGAGVLIRAMQPLAGIETMMKNRQTDTVQNLCNGPGKLCKALGIDARMNGTDVLGDTLFLVDDGTRYAEIVERPRVGIREAADWLWRFYPAEMVGWVSKK